MSQDTLTFSKANTKIRKLSSVLGVKRSEIYGFSLPAGWTCPAARECLAKADQETGKLTDGPECRFRCFAASMEAMYPATRAMVWRNLNALKSAGVDDWRAMRDLILRSLPDNAKVVRIHVSGDFFNPHYLHAWVAVAKARRDIVFYGYTKSLHLLVPFMPDLPSNLRLTYSYGGKYDSWIDDGFVWPTAYVVLDPDEAARRDLPIDHKDSLAVSGSHDFALLIHGPQPKGSRAAIASRANRMRKID